MNFLNELAQAKRLANVEGAVLYVSDKGRIRKQLSGKEKQAYKVEMKKGTQYVFDENKKQIQPQPKPRKKSTSNVQDVTDAPMD